MDRNAFTDGDRLLAAFASWAAGQRTADAAGARSRERSLVDQAAGEATWSGLLVDLSERQEEVTVDTGARRVRGKLVGVGRDFCVISSEGSNPVLVPTDKIASVWSESAASGSRFPELDLPFTAALAGLADERSPVCVVLEGGSALTGDLIATGADVVSVRTDPPARRTAHARIGHIAICELR